MSLQCGIVGLPNVGKSTLFNALTQAGIEAENYPFCTIEPKVGIVEVPDPRLIDLAKIVKPQRTLPAVVEFVDIAGLVAGASRSEERRVGKEGGSRRGAWQQTETEDRHAGGAVRQYCRAA